MGSNNHSTPQARWAVTTTLLSRLDACHRSLLRSILDMRWPNGIISSEDLYVRCGTGPLWHMTAVAQDRCHSKYGGCLDPCSAMCCACPRISPHNCPSSLLLLGQIDTGAELVGTPPIYLTCCDHTSKRRRQVTIGQRPCKTQRDGD